MEIDDDEDEHDEDEHDEDEHDEDEHDEEGDDRFLNGLMEAMARSYGALPMDALFISDLVFPAPVKDPAGR